MLQIKQLRLDAGLTQEAVTEALGLNNKSTVSKWETGKSVPRTAVLPRLANLYDCTIDALLGNKENSAPSLHTMKS